MPFSPLVLLLFLLDSGLFPGQMGYLILPSCFQCLRVSYQVYVLRLPRQLDVLVMQNTNKSTFGFLYQILDLTGKTRQTRKYAMCACDSTQRSGNRHLGIDRYFQCQNECNHALCLNKMRKSLFGV